MQNFRGIAIRVEYRKNGYSHPVGFCDAYTFFNYVNHKHGRRQSSHILDSQEIFFKLGQSLIKLDSLFFGQQPKIPLFFLLLEVNHVIDTGSDSLKIGQGPTQPSLIHIPHVTSISFALYYFLGLFFCSNE